MDNNNLKSKTDAAKYLGIGWSTFHYIAKKGLVKPSKVDGLKKPKYDVVELDRYREQILNNNNVIQMKGRARSNPFAA